MISSSMCLMITACSIPFLLLCALTEQARKGGNYLLKRESKWKKYCWKKSPLTASDPIIHGCTHLWGGDKRATSKGHLRCPNKQKIKTIRSLCSVHAAFCVQWPAVRYLHCAICSAQCVCCIVYCAACSAQCVSCSVYCGMCNGKCRCKQCPVCVVSISRQNEHKQSKLSMLSNLLLLSSLTICL